MTSVDYDHNAAALRNEQAALEYELAQVQRELAAARIEAHHHHPQQQVHAQQLHLQQPQLQPQPQHQLSRNVARITGRPSSSSRPGTAAALLNGTNLTRAAHEEFLRITARAQSAALRRYFDAVNGHDDFEQRRQERLANAAPFSFEMREMTKPKSRTAERAEQDRLERERAEEEMRNTRFKARPVPASTFEPRYAAMVDDAAAHREAVRAVAQERGLQLVQAEQQRQEFTAAMREAQNELQPRRAKRNMTPDEAFAEWQRTHCQQFRANPVPSTTYSSENRLQADRDATRAMRVKARAEAMLQTARAPPRMEAAAATAGDANPTTTARGLVARDAFVADLASKPSLSAVERKRQEREALRERNANFTFAPQISGDPPAFEALWARERLARAVVKQKFRDCQRQTESTARDFGATDGDGGFTALRAHSAKAAAQREMRLRRAHEAFVRATDGQVPPELLLQQQLGAADAADPLKAAVILEAAVDDVTRRRANGEAVVGAPVMRSVVGVGARSASAAPAAADSRPCQVPRTTHAHVLRAASTYKHIVSRAEDAERKASEDEARRKRQAAANERLRAMGVAPSVKASAAAGPQAKTRALLLAGPAADTAAAPSSGAAGGVDWDARAAQKRREVEEATRAAKAQLDAMKERVRAQPPVFVAEAQAEATLENLTKARAETEARVMAAWRSSGLTPVDMQAALRASAAGADGGAISQDDAAAAGAAAVSKTRGGIEASAAPAAYSSTYNSTNLDNHTPQPASATADTRPASPVPAAAVSAAAHAAPVPTTTAAPVRSRSSSTSSSSSSSSSSSFASSSSSD